MADDEREPPFPEGWPPKAYENDRFLFGREGRPLRLLAEYLEPMSRFEQLNVSDTIVMFGSSRILSPEDAEAVRRAVDERGGDLGAEEELKLSLSRYYEDARRLAHDLTGWSKRLADKRRRFIVCSGGGPGIMEAANRGASEAGGLNIGLNISIPTEQMENPYISRELAFEFHYFFMRKFWFAYLAKAMVIFPGGFGTMDEMFEILTLIQTRKLHKPMPIVLFGKPFWDEVINFDALVKWGTVSPHDLELFHTTDDVDEAFRFVTEKLEENALDKPGGSL